MSASVQERRPSRIRQRDNSNYNNKTISHLMKNLDLIKNINRQNRIHSKNRKESNSGSRYLREGARSTCVISPL
jgi:predicted ATPase with chaperone activity